MSRSAQAPTTSPSCTLLGWPWSGRTNWLMCPTGSGPPFRVMSSSSQTAASSLGSSLRAIACVLIRSSPPCWLRSSSGGGTWRTGSYSLSSRSKVMRASVGTSLRTLRRIELACSHLRPTAGGSPTVRLPPSIGPPSHPRWWRVLPPPSQSSSSAPPMVLSGRAPPRVFRRWTHVALLYVAYRCG